MLRSRETTIRAAMAEAQISRTSPESRAMEAQITSDRMEINRRSRHREESRMVVLIRDNRELRASSIPAIWAKCHRRLRLRQGIFPWCWMPTER